MMAEWMNKKVYLETFSGRRYSGKVIEESEVKLVLRDIKNYIVELSKIDVKLIQEEE
jgi:small nuclear ribonucleoprotein (snRNP)-like protein